MLVTVFISHTWSPSVEITKRWVGGHKGQEALEFSYMYLNQMEILIFLLLNSLSRTVSTLWSCQHMYGKTTLGCDPQVQIQYSTLTHDPVFLNFILDCLFDSQSIKSIQLTLHNPSPTGEDKLRTNWLQQQHLLLHPLHKACISSSGQERAWHTWENEREKKQHLKEQVGELLGRQDCHVCINRHWFFCPALAPPPFILSFVAGAQRGQRNSVTVQSGPRGLCVRIDFTCKRGGGPEPLNKGTLCHQRARSVKSHQMDNETQCG